MSKTCGATAAPPDFGTAVMFRLLPPVDGYRHAVPPAFFAAWSWYCHRSPTVGCQHGLPVHATGAGQPAVAQVADAGCAISTIGATSAAENTTIVTSADVRRIGPSSPRCSGLPDFGGILRLSPQFCQTRSRQMSVSERLARSGLPRARP